MMKLRYAIFVGFVIVSNIAFAVNGDTHSAPRKPDWTKGTEKIESDKFQYFVGVGTANSIEKAQQNAVQNVLVQIADSKGGDYIVGSESQSNTSEITTANSSTVINQFEFKAIVKGVEQNISIPCLAVVEFYWDKTNGGDYNYWALVRIPNQKSNCELPFYKPYKASAFVRSAIVPGWGQLYKKQTVKGIVFLSTEIMAVGGALAANSISANLFVDAYSTNNLYDRQTLLDKSKNLETVRNLLFITAGTVYIFNLIDAITSRGKPLYTFNNNKLYLKPYYTPISSGVTMKLVIK